MSTKPSWWVVAFPSASRFPDRKPIYTLWALARCNRPTGNTQVTCSHGKCPRAARRRNTHDTDGLADEKPSRFIHRSSLETWKPHRVATMSESATEKPCFLQAWHCGFLTLYSMSACS